MLFWEFKLKRMADAACMADMLQRGGANSCKQLKSRFAGEFYKLCHPCSGNSLALRHSLEKLPGDDVKL